MALFGKRYSANDIDEIFPETTEVQNVKNEHACKVHELRTYLEDEIIMYDNRIRMDKGPPDRQKQTYCREVCINALNKLKRVFEVIE